MKNHKMSHLMKDLMKSGILSALIACSMTPMALSFTLSYDSANQRNINGWKNPVISFNTNFSTCPATVSSDALTDAITKALAIWNGVPSSKLNLSLGTTVTTTAAEALATSTAGTPLIVCDSAFSSGTGLDGDAVPAAALVTAVDSADYSITNSVILINAEAGKRANIANVDAVTLSIVLAHEIGHALGLGHSSDVNALMYYDATAKTKLSLAKDDVDGITYLYPRNELSGSKMMGCNSVAPIGPPRISDAKGSAPSGDDRALMIEFVLLISACWLGLRWMQSTGLPKLI